MRILFITGIFLLFAPIGSALFADAQSYVNCTGTPDYPGQPAVDWDWTVTQHGYAYASYAPQDLLATLSASIEFDGVVVAADAASWVGDPLGDSIQIQPTRTMPGVWLSSYTVVSKSLAATPLDSSRGFDYQTDACG